MQSILQFFVIEFSATVQDRRLIFLSIDNDLLHRGIENRYSPIYSSLYMSFFSSSPFLSKTSPKLYKISYLVHICIGKKVHSWYTE